jgi:hypothetical protein
VGPEDSGCHRRGGGGGAQAATGASWMKQTIVRKKTDNGVFSQHTTGCAITGPNGD